MINFNHVLWCVLHDYQFTFISVQTRHSFFRSIFFAWMHTLTADNLQLCRLEIRIADIYIDMVCYCLMGGFINKVSGIWRWLKRLFMPAGKMTFSTTWNISYNSYNFNSVWEEILSDWNAGIDIQPFSSRSFWSQTSLIVHDAKSIVPVLVKLNADRK